jgi:hypothetical protein
VDLLAVELDPIEAPIEVSRLGGEVIGVNRRI